MEKAKQQEIIAAADQYMALKKIKRAQLAREVGISDATVSQIWNGKYLGDPSAVLKKVARHIGFDTEAKPQKEKTWRRYNTNNLAAIQEMCADAQENSRFLAMSAKTDLGKTTGLEHYRIKSGAPNVHYVLCDVNMTRKEFLNAILRSMGLSTEGTIYERMNRICVALLKANKPLLILDDVGKLPDNCLRQIQVIYDNTETGGKRYAGIILAGTDHLERYINKMADKGKMGFDEFRRRIEYWQPLAEINDSFIKGVAEEFGITDPDAVSYLIKNVKGYQVLRDYMLNYQKYITKHPNTEISQREIIYSLTHKSV